jgi:adenosine deaminase CECR1
MSRVRDLAWPSGMPDDEWAEVVQGVPAKDEPFIKKYLDGREALIAQEKKQRSGKQHLSPSRALTDESPDHAFRQSLSPLAKEACSIVDRIREEEQRTIWTSEFEDILAQKTGANVYPGMMFSLAKEKMEKTKLWQIVRKMPKGALLHAHMDAMVDFDYLFDVLLETKGMHIHCMHPLSTPASLEGAPVKFKFRKEEQGIILSFGISQVTDTQQVPGSRYGAQIMLQTRQSFSPKPQNHSLMAVKLDFCPGLKIVVPSQTPNR